MKFRVILPSSNGTGSRKAEMFHQDEASNSLEYSRIENNDYPIFERNYVMLQISVPQICFPQAFIKLSGKEDGSYPFIRLIIIFIIFVRQY